MSLFDKIRDYFNKPVTDNAQDGDNLPPETVEPGKDMVVTSFELLENNCSAQEEGYAYSFDGDKAVLRSIIRTSDYVDSEYVNTDRVVNAVEGGRELAETVNALFKQNRVNKWNGFVGNNPPGVLDGTTMNFDAKLLDGSKISASGSNNFPKNYRVFRNGLYDLVNLITPMSREITYKDVSFCIPEEWLGMVSLRYSGSCVVMEYGREDKRAYLIRFEYTDFDDGYTGDDVLNIGTLKKGEETYYLRFILYRENNGNVFECSKTLTDEQKAYLKSIYSGDIRQKIAKTVKAVNGAVLEGGNE
ncbi:MAG: hypothetical protein K6F92_07350 [Lachnospiraceae bacterium]|nr:hypothetical protein [Lachnospiraceae bacterium]